MADAKKRRKAVASGVVGLASLMGVATVGLVIGASIIEAPAAVDTAAPMEDAEADDAATAGAGPASGDWAAIAGSAMLASGFDFATAQFDAGVLTIGGDAPDPDARENAFEVGVEAVQNDPEHQGIVLAFNNAITVAGVVQASVPDAARALGEAPEAEQCQTAFNTLLEGRVVNFETGSAQIAEESCVLLAGLADIAKRCVDYRVEVRGHTDAQGDAVANQALSERRAQSVADYLVRAEVAPDQLGITGLGETEPLDTSGSEEGDARNRRIEFRVLEQE